MKIRNGFLTLPNDFCNFKAFPGVPLDVNMAKYCNNAKVLSFPSDFASKPFILFEKTITVFFSGSKSFNEERRTAEED